VDVSFLIILVSKLGDKLNFYPESEVLTVRTHINIDLYLQLSLSKRTKLSSCLLSTTAESLIARAMSK
jgi:hypothetical protein